MGNNFLDSSLSSVVSMDLSSSWAARSWQNAYSHQNDPELRVKYCLHLNQAFLVILYQDTCLSVFFLTLITLDRRGMR
jgi:hypothetical protein